MLSILLIVALALALLLSYAPRPDRPRRCTCGRPADVVDHDRPWIVYCGKCFLEKEGRM